MRPALLLSLALVLPTLHPAAADGFTPAQRAEIVQIMRDALKSDPSILRDAVATMQADEEQNRDRMASDAIARLGAKLIDPADAVEGNPRGDITVVEFYDTRCPYCRRMLPVMTDLLKAEPNVRIVMKDLPILGPTSQLESRALLAAQKQGGYFKLRDAIMRTNAPSTPDTLRETATRVGLDGSRLMRDMDDPAIKSRLDANIMLAQQLGIQGTPAMVVGRHMISGATDLADLRQAIADARHATN